MKYIFLGTIAPEWIGRHEKRLQSCKVKADELGMTFEAINYTQGIYDFIDVVEASDTFVVLGFSIWYAKQGYGKITTMPAFDEAKMEKAVQVVGPHHWGSERKKAPPELFFTFDGSGEGTRSHSGRNANPRHRDLCSYLAFNPSPHGI